MTPNLSKPSGVTFNLNHKFSCTAIGVCVKEFKDTPKKIFRYFSFPSPRVVDFFH